MEINDGAVSYRANQFETRISSRCESLHVQISARRVVTCIFVDVIAVFASTLPSPQYSVSTQPGAHFP
jgi:hypothetical protein